MSTFPKISIVTPSFQQGEFLEETIISVLDQHYPNLEYIIIDGGSTDASIDIIKKYEKHLQYWVSEKDNGQSDAINKGLQLSTGEVFNWLNSDDRLAPGSLQKVGEAFAAVPDLLCYGGQIHHFDQNGSKLFDELNDPSDPEQLHCDPVINQMATFYSGITARKLNVEKALHYAMDYGLWIKTLLSEGHERMKFERIHLADFRLHDAQKTDAGSAPFVNDMANILAALAEANNEKDLSAILRTGHQNNDDLGGFGQKCEPKMLKKMIAYFMLKWHHQIYSAQELDMMKAFVQWATQHPTSIPIQFEDRLSDLREQVKAPNWLAFRLKRKLKHLGA